MASFTPRPFYSMIPTEYEARWTLHSLERCEGKKEKKRKKKKREEKRKERKTKEKKREKKKEKRKETKRIERKRKQNKNANRIVVCNPESKELLGRSSSRWEHTNKMYLKGAVSENVISIHLAQNVVMRRLTTGIRSEKCVVRRFRRRANVIECTYTNLDIIAYYTPSLYSIPNCS